MVRNAYIGLLYECPFEKDCKKCQLSDIRKLTFLERIEWWYLLTDEEIDKIINNHKI